MVIIGDMNVIDVETFGILKLKIQRHVQIKIVGLHIGIKKELDENE